MRKLCARAFVNAREIIRRRGEKVPETFTIQKKKKRIRAMPIKSLLMLKQSS